MLNAAVAVAILVSVLFARPFDEYQVVSIQNVSTQLLLTRDWCAVDRGLTLRRLMSYIYMEHPFLMFLDHTQRRSTVGRTPLDE